jgi:hypothetical protein
MIKFNPNNIHQQFIISGLVGLVEDDGLSPHDALRVLEEIKRNVFFALAEISAETKKS